MAQPGSALGWGPSGRRFKSCLPDISKPAWEAGSSVLRASIRPYDIDEETGELRCKLSDGSLLDVKPAAREADDDPPNWELSTPGGVVLEFGPGVRWQVSSADAPVSSHR